MANDPIASGRSSRAGQSAIIDPPGAAGPLHDQAALHGLLERIRDLNLMLLSVAYGGPSTQDSDKNHKEKS